ncbi:shikimate 5-dehydrogenase [Corynebacterium sp. ES2794-CONJ1]|uniref:shikimate 5-dehydrogenase n=1 Tax=Corynebacterium sp. ES2794-CONJ1 TaxID=2980553 RepID=UPI0021DB006A|nr:shikimate 5-dehydrogenase [Corynebacterium sp. ES2794-CONJ1]MCU9519278.1 shikimate 5-dehydrogenase [Corynebacterium sp. ES2794-CONJ1]
MDSTRTLTVNRETTLCISLAARPSNHGVRFHNYLYRRLGLNFSYHAIAPQDIDHAVAGIRGLNIRGAGISMPYKQAVIDLIDSLDPSAERIAAVNTIVNTNGHLRGYNTDYLAVSQLLRTHHVDPSLKVSICGAGGMAKAVVAALADHGFEASRCTVVARRAEKAKELAEKYRWSYATRVPRDQDMLINATPLGMEGPHRQQSAFDHSDIARAAVIFDVVAHPSETPLIRAARGSSPISPRTVITGDEVIALQAAAQFTLYTGVTLDPELVNEAEAFARGKK